MSQQPIARIFLIFLLAVLIAMASASQLHAQNSQVSGPILDPSGQSLSGENKYLLKFPAGQVPPIDALWSLTLYGQNVFLAENQINQYSIGDRTVGLVYGSDGSLKIQVQAEPPASGTSNWLPSPPSGAFQLIVKRYQPRPALFNGSDKIPPLQKV